MDEVEGSQVRWVYQRVRCVYVVSSPTMVNLVVPPAYVSSTPSVLNESTRFDSVDFDLYFD